MMAPFESPATKIGLPGFIRFNDLQLMACHRVPNSRPNQIVGSLTGRESQPTSTDCSQTPEALSLEIAMPRLFAPFVSLPIILSTWAHAQTQPASTEPTLWDHNGSVMSLVAKSSSREFYYLKPRPGMLEAGAKPGSLLFRGEVNNGQYSGTAFIFNPRCRQIPFQVKGAMLDNDERVVLTGQAPRVGRNCRSYAFYTSDLEFTLLKSIAESRSPEVQDSGDEKTKPEATLTDADKTSTGTAQPSAPHDDRFEAKDMSENAAGQPLGVRMPQPGAKKEAFGADNLDDYVLTGALFVLIGALFFISASLFPKLFWRKRRFY
jgi:hypothetical protein